MAFQANFIDEENIAKIQGMYNLRTKYGAIKLALYLGANRPVIKSKIKKWGKE